MLRAALLAALLCPCAPALAQTPAVLADDAASRAIEAEKLVALLTPEDRLIEMGKGMFGPMLDARIAGEPAAKALFDQNPGLRQRFVKLLQAEFGPMLETVLPDYRADVRALLIAELTAQDMRDIFDLFSSSIGKRLFDAAIVGAARYPDDPEDVAAAKVVMEVFRTITPEEQAFLASFENRSGSFKRFEGVKQQLPAIQARMIAKLDREHGERLRAAVDTVMRDTLAKQKAQ